MGYDFYELSERERQIVFTALDLYREAAEKQLEATEKKLRIYTAEVAEVIDVLNDSDAGFGLLHRKKSAARCLRGCRVAPPPTHRKERP